ncbi:hypothetical protein ACXR2W_03670 [Leucobacter sp. HY1908]
MDAQGTHPESIRLSYYFTVLWRQRLVVLSGIALGLIVALGVLVFAPRTVTATTAVNLNVITTEPFNQQRPASGLLDVQTEADIASSHVVAQEASKLLDGRLSAAEVREASKVSAAGGATVVRVAFTAPTQQQAVAGADAVAAAYLSVRKDQAEQRIDAMLSSLNTRLEALNKDLLEINKVLIAAAPDSTEYAQAASQLQQVQVELDGLLSQRNALSSVDTTGGIILTSAQDSYPVQSPSRTMTLATGLAVGLVLGVIAAYVWNARDRRLRTTAEIAAALRAPQLASLEPPRGQARERGRTQGGPDLAGLTSAQLTEQMRVVRERLHGASSTAASAAAYAAPANLLLYDARRQEAAPLTPDALGEVTEGEVEITVAQQGESLADQLAALREAKSVIVLCSPRTARTDDLEWLRTEADAASTQVLGFIVEP